MISADTLDRITSYPSLSFSVVVNPASGPGMGAGPDGNYTREIQRLNAYANVRTVGYVSTDYTNRNLSLVLQDISTYSAWAENATFPGLGMHGIFLDETPTKYDTASAQFFEAINAAVKVDTGLGNNPLVSYFPFRQYVVEVKQQHVQPRGTPSKRHCSTSCHPQSG
jgi:hypothetical protein